MVLFNLFPRNESRFNNSTGICTAIQNFIFNPSENIINQCFFPEFTKITGRSESETLFWIPV